MNKHLGYSLIGGLLFLFSTIVVVWIFDQGIHEGLLQVISNSKIVQASMRASFWIGTLAGGISSIVLRKSVNHKVYIWIVMIFVLIMTEVVIATLL